MGPTQPTALEVFASAGRDPFSKSGSEPDPVLEQASRAALQSGANTRSMKVMGILIGETVGRM